MLVKLRTILSIIVLCFPLGRILTQEEEKMTFRDRIFFGGDFSLQFGTITFIELSPIVGYRVTPRLAPGFGIIYQYYRDKTFRDVVFKTHIYGGRVFTRYLLVKDFNNVIPLGLHAGIIGYTEYEFLNLDRQFSNSLIKEGRFWLHSFYVGGGLELPVSRRARMNFIVLYNLNDTGESPYSNPLVRIGIIF